MWGIRCACRSGTDRPMGVAQYKLHKVPPKELSVAAESIARLSVSVDETYAQTKVKEDFGHRFGPDER